MVVGMPEAAAAASSTATAANAGSAAATGAAGATGANGAAGANANAATGNAGATEANKAAPAAIPSIDLGKAAAAPFALPDSHKHLAPEFAKLGDKAGEAFKGIEIHHASRVAEVAAWKQEIEARPTYTADKAVLDAWIVQNVPEAVIKDLNATGYGTKPAVFDWLLTMAKRNGAGPLVKAGSEGSGGSQSGLTAEQIANRARFPRMFENG